MIALGEWQRRGSERTLLGRRIFVIDSGGEGAPVLCLHGFPSASWDWSGIWDALARDHRMVAFDFLGLGLSEKPRGHRYTIGEQADLAEAVVMALALRLHHVLAHDYGDTVAQELLARDNARAEPAWASLCLLNGGLFPETHHALPSQRLLASPLGPLMVHAMRRRNLRKSLRTIFGPATPPSEQDIDVLWVLLQREHGTRAIPSLLGYMRERREHRERWVGALRGCRVPMMLINGSADPVSGAHMVARFREVVGESGATKVAEQSGVGHYPQIEAPERVVEELSAWWGALPGESAHSLPLARGRQSAPR